MALRRGSSAVMDVVTVFHNETNHKEALALQDTLRPSIDAGIITFTAIDNTKLNRGFAGGCNLGASLGDSPIIGFLNPDVVIYGPFVEQVQQALVPPIVITGCRFGKSRREIAIWGCKDWVCGAAFFVDREWFEARGGFDPIFRWSWEETDLIRQAQADNRMVVSLDLPIYHESPSNDSTEDAKYKNKWFNHGAKLFNQKWRTHG